MDCPNFSWNAKMDLQKTIPEKTKTKEDKKERNGILSQKKIT